jgi:hypothetical protein
MSLPTIPFGNYKITRLIAGGNPLCGNSHFSPEMDVEMCEYYTPEQVVAFLQGCQAAGINTLQARGDYHRILYWVELFRRSGGQLHWIAQTASEMHDVFQNIRILAAAGTIGIYHHGSRTDKYWQAGQIDKVRDYLKCMRDCGVQVGLGTHIPEVIEYSEEHGWDVDYYMACLYNLTRKPRESALVTGRFQPEEFIHEDRDRMCEVIRQTPKLCLAFKLMAASRNCGTQECVREAFRYAFQRIKPNDAVVVGMFPKNLDHITLNVEHTIKVCEELSQQENR